MVWMILRTYEYTGALVQGKVTRLMIGSNKTRRVPKDKGVVYEGHHEAIVTHDEFEKARMILCKRISDGGNYYYE